jgi:DNA mismatch repair ATPase MutS
MRQYFEAKRQYRDAIVFFRMGDFYEMFYEDALTGARALELTLTSRSKDASGGAIPMCGVPYHAADGYIARLVKKGSRPSRGRPRRLARHADRCQLPRGTRARVPDGRCAGPAG